MRRLFFYISLILLVTVLPGCSKDAENQEEALVPVKVYNVKPESLERYIKLNGTITAAKDQVVYSKISERIEKIYVKAGSRVGANQKIAEQYNAIFLQAFDAAKANSENAEAQLELTQQNYDRMVRLFNQKAISTQQSEQISTQLKAAKAALEAAQAQLKQAREQVENSIIKSPFSGVAASVFVEENQMLPAGQPVAQIIDPSTMKSKVRISVKDIPFIKRGQDVVVSVPTAPGKKYSGVINSIDQAVDPLSKTLEAEIIIKNADANVKSGMQGDFLIAVTSVKNTVVVPENALLSQTEVRINRETGKQEPVKKYFLFVVDSSRAVLKEVKTGLSGDSRIQITEGIKPNDKVIVVGNNIVREGQKVNIID